jgi:hypothetical protein
VPNVPIIYRSKVLLAGSSPPIWQRLEVAGSTRLDSLSDIIQAAFDWEGFHLHAFEVVATDYSLPFEQDDWNPNSPKDEGLYTLSRIAKDAPSFL